MPLEILKFGLVEAEIDKLDVNRTIFSLFAIKLKWRKESQKMLEGI